MRRSLDDLRGKIETLVQNQIVGFQNSLLDLQIDLRRVFSNKPLVYGNPANSQYWVAQADETAYLMAAAMVINRLTGATVTADSLVTEAMATNSTTRPNRKMYLGPTTPDYVWPADAYQLMENHGVSVTTTSYSRTQGRRALAALETALAEGKSVIVTVNGPAVSLADPGQEEIGEHPVVVLAIDITNDVVYFNDGALPQGGQQRTMPLDKFIDTWRTSFYNATFAVAAPVTPQAVSPATEAIAA
ncbi:C39 family peptidase [Mycolicibacterium sp. BK556]|uniref:C39 family peptidase n=1 Tax=Mycolicibacterium sp. BK556 TaxID=2587125 RepID=UPI00351C9D7D